MQLHIQTELRSGKTIPEVCDPLSIAYKIKDGKAIFTYSLIDSPKTHPIVRECRGLILYTDNWDVASYGFERFLNYGESGADVMPENLEGCLVLEKLDGTMCNLWFDRTTQEWRVSTRSMIYAEGPVGDLTNKTFADLFWEGLGFTPLYLKGNLMFGRREYSYTFELTSPYNRIVTPYKETRVTLLTARHLVYLDETSRIAINRIARDFNCSVPKAFSINNWEQLLKMEGLAETDEGFVVVRESKEGSHKRVKVKNLAYLAVSKLTSRVSETAFMELIQLHKHDDFMAYKPEYKDHFDKLLIGIKQVEKIVREDYINITGMPHVVDQKSFALEALKCKFPSLLFQLRSGKITNLGNDLLLMRAEALVELIHSVQDRV